MAVGKQMNKIDRLLINPSSGGWIRFLITPVIFLILLAFVIACSSSIPKPVLAEYSLPVPQGRALETVDPPGFIPDMGKWMIAPAGSVANWLGQRARGKIVNEPINVVIIDPYAKDGTDAEARLVAGCKAAGFDVRTGHSSGYGAIIEGFVYPELPRGPGDAFSDNAFVFNNNHGRIFGPHYTSSGWIFVGAFSREIINLSNPIPHTYESMNRARDAFVVEMVSNAAYELIDFLDLKNAILFDANNWCGDHDGVAPLIRASR